jgi:hypothetical protein
LISSGPAYSTKSPDLSSKDTRPTGRLDHQPPISAATPKADHFEERFVIQTADLTAAQEELEKLVKVRETVDHEREEKAEALAAVEILTAEKKEFTGNRLTDPCQRRDGLW